MPSTRQITKDKLEAMITKLQSIEQTAIDIGMTYQESDVILSGVMFAISTMVETCIPLIEQANNEL